MLASGGGYKSRTHIRLLSCGNLITKANLWQPYSLLVVPFPPNPVIFLLMRQEEELRDSGVTLKECLPRTNREDVPIS